jgi:phosphoenolpyruvate carboxykinase (GTP)
MSANYNNAPAFVKHAGIKAWVEQIAKLTQPDAIYWCDGSTEEYDRLCGELVNAGTFKRLNPALKPIRRM